MLHFAENYTFEYTNTLENYPRIERLLLTAYLMLLLKHEIRRIMQAL
jgi:hypothetical protein